MHYFPQNTGPQKTAFDSNFPQKQPRRGKSTCDYFARLFFGALDEDASDASLERYLYRSAGKVENQQEKGAAGAGNRR